jgi:hypothetical protein
MAAITVGWQCDKDKCFGNNSILMFWLSHLADKKQRPSDASGANLLL